LASDSSASRVLNKLHAPLSVLAGNAGYRSLLSRALALATGQCSELGKMQVRTDGTLLGMDTLDGTCETDGVKTTEAEILISELLGLLITFVGQALTMHVLRNIWPQPLSGYHDLDSENER